jgi:hypothetical protein
MRKFANLLQVFLIGNGILALLAGLFPGALPGSLPEQLAAGFGSIVVVLALLFLPCLAFNRNLPKRIFLPQIFLLFWAAAGLWPLSALLGPLPAQRLAAIGQILLGGLALYAIRRRNGTSLLLTPEMFAEPAFRVGSLLRFGLASLLLAPVALLFFGFSLAASHVDRLSGGFVRLGLDGLYMTERSYVREDKTIRLSGMIHIADQGYYDELARSIPAGRTLVLAEGVSDRDGLLRRTFSYDGVADLLGLSSQKEMRLEGRLIDVERLAQEDFRAAKSGLPDIARADSDLRDFDPRTLAFIDALAEHLLSSSSLAEGFTDFNSWAREHVTAETNDILINDLVTRRNRVVIGHLGAALKKYDTIIIPWGALHMVGIEKAVIERGFVLQESKQRRSIDFSEIPYAALLEQLGTAAD